MSVSQVIAIFTAVPGAKLRSVVRVVSRWHGKGGADDGGGVRSWGLDRPPRASA